MKKTIRTVAFLLGLVVLSLAVASCGEGLSVTTTTTTANNDTQEAETYEPMNFYTTDLSAYITLGEYKNLTIEVDKLEITDEDVEKQIRTLLESQAAYEKITEGNVTADVKFNIDYAGYIDEIQFDGGTNTDQTVYIKDGELCFASGGKFIDGFAEPLLGAAVGDRVEINVTFPEDYHNEEFAGKDATFYVTVNYICGEETVPEFTDDWVYDFTKGSYKTAEDFKNYLKEELVASLETVHSAAVWNKVMENATYIEIPEQQYLYYYNNYKSSIEYYASYFGMTYEAFLSDGYANYMFGLNIKSDKELQEFATDMVKEELAFFAVMKAEELTVTDEEYEVFMADLVENSEYTREEIEESYSRDDIVLQMLVSETQEIIFEINTFTEKQESAE